MELTVIHNLVSAVEEGRRNLEDGLTQEVTPRDSHHAGVPCNVVLDVDLWHITWLRQGNDKSSGAVLSFQLRHLTIYHTDHPGISPFRS
jgi:hypothetical protein